MKTNIQIKTIFGIIFGIFTTILWGCKADLNPYEELESNEYIQLYFTKTETTRADIGEDGSGSFNEGDCVGVYINNGSDIQYRELTFEGGEWLPKLKRQDFGPGQLTLSAHYPVVSGVSDIAKDQYDFKVELDQSETGKEKSDLLVSQTVLNEN